MNKCPKCGRWLKDVTCRIDQLTDDIEDVTGFCKKHGCVRPDDWEADQFETGSEPVSHEKGTNK